MAARLKKKEDREDPPTACPHCWDRVVSQRTFFKHRKRYFRDGVWEKDMSMLQTMDDDSDGAAPVYEETKGDDDEHHRRRRGAGSGSKGDMAEAVPDAGDDSGSDFEPRSARAKHVVAPASDDDEDNPRDGSFGVPAGDEEEEHLGRKRHADDSDGSGDEKKGREGKRSDRKDGKSAKRAERDVSARDGKEAKAPADGKAPPVDDDPLYQAPARRGAGNEPTARKFFALQLLILTWAVFFRVSEIALALLLKILYDVLTLGEGKGLPRLSTHLLYKNVGVDEDDFQRLVSCPDCQTVYTEADCIRWEERPVFDNGKRVGVKRVPHPKTCSHIEIPGGRGPYSKPCGSKLLKKVNTLAGGRFVPIVMYPYKGIIARLAELLQRPDFLPSCEHWRARAAQVPAGHLCDIYDGQLWLDFNSDEEPFFRTPGNLGLQLNCDWMQPYRHSVYSVGVIYAVVLNLPRDQRFLPKNLITIGIIPGPSEKGIDMNKWMAPVVRELQKLWQPGVRISTAAAPGGQRIRAALLGISADTPAARKLCGFQSHSAAQGCQRCVRDCTYLPEPDGSKDKRGKPKRYQDYSGGWDAPAARRTKEEVLDNARKWKAAKTKTDRMALRAKSGNRWSVLMDLPYFDPVRMCSIDFMHNILLGTTKMLLKLFVAEEILTDKDLDKVQSRVDRMKIPEDVGRITGKLQYCGNFNASELASLLLVFGDVALLGTMDDQYLKLWQHLSKAGRLLCARVLTRKMIDEGHRELMAFCKLFEKTFKNKKGARVRPNMHYHQHLRECLFYFGPAYAFWCFSFERFNGLLGAANNNNRDVELSMMRALTARNALSTFTSVATDFAWDVSTQADTMREITAPKGVVSTDLIARDSVELATVLGYATRGDNCDGSEPVPGGPWSKKPRERALTLAEQTLVRKKLMEEWHEEIAKDKTMTLIEPWVTVHTRFNLAGSLIGSTAGRSDSASFVLLDYTDHKGKLATWPAQVTAFWTIRIKRPTVQEHNEMKSAKMRAHANNMSVQRRASLALARYSQRGFVAHHFAYVRFYAAQPPEEDADGVEFLPELSQRRWKANAFYEPSWQNLVPVVRIKSRYVPAFSYDKAKVKWFRICALPHKATV